MRVLVALFPVLFVLLLSTLCPGQPGDSFVIWDSYELTRTPVSIHRISATGQLLSTVTTLPARFEPYLVEAGADNQSWIVAGYFFPASYPPTTFPFPRAILEVDASGKVTTLVANAPLEQVMGMVRSCDGDWILLNGIPGKPTEFHRLRGNLLSLAARAKGALNIWGGVTLETDSGQILGRGMTNYAPLMTGYLRMDPRTGAVTSLHLLNTINLGMAAKSTVYEPSTGTLVEVYQDNYCWAQMARVHPGKKFTWMSLRWMGKSAEDIVTAGQRSHGIGYYVICRSSTLPTGKCRFWDITAVCHDGTWLKSHIVQGVPPIRRTGLRRIGSRHLSWFMDSLPNGRSLHLDFPGEGGRNYVVGLSVAGFRPGFQLADGRAVPLVPDRLTGLCLQGGVPGVIERTTGCLDSKGHATVKVDTNLFGSALDGLRAWAVVLVLDPAAPCGVAHIVGPTLLRI